MKSFRQWLDDKALLVELKGWFDEQGISLSLPMFAPNMGVPFMNVGVVSSKPKKPKKSKKTKKH